MTAGIYAAWTGLALAAAFLAGVPVWAYLTRNPGTRARGGWRLPRATLPRRHVRRRATWTLRDEDAQTLTWVRQLRQRQEPTGVTWTTAELRARIAALAVITGQAQIPPTETPDVAPTDIPGVAAVRIAEQTCRAKPDRPTDPGVIATPGIQLDYDETNLGWADLRELAAMLAADGAE